MRIITVIPCAFASPPPAANYATIAACCRAACTQNGPAVSAQPQPIVFRAVSGPTPAQRPPKLNLSPPMTFTSSTARQECMRHADLKLQLPNSRALPAVREDVVYFTCTLGQAPSHGRDQAFTNINDFLRRNAELYPDTPAVGFYLPPAGTNQPWQSRVLTFAEILQGSCASARMIADKISIPAGETIGLLCSSTAEFLFTWLALIRLGHPALLIAPQCSPSAIIGLCKQCRVTQLLHDDTYQELAEKSAGADLTTHMTPITDPFELARQPLQGPIPDSTASRDEVAYLHHTSGTSAGAPKPIPQTHYGGAGAYALLDGTQHATFTTTPLYHGGVADSFRAWTSRALIWLFPGKGTPITAKNIMKCLKVAAEADAPPVKYFSSVPYVLEMMAAEESGIQMLREMDIVAVGGAALPSEVGNRLVDQGVRLISRMGSAECGFVMSSHRDYASDREWEYLRVHGELVFEEREDNLHELIIPPSWPFISKTAKVSEDGSFATRDLFRRHPTLPNSWRYDSRADAQLTLITGKKFDPAPLEDALAAKSPHLRDVLIFGNGRPYPGALLFRSSKSVDKSDEELLYELYATIEQINQDSQAHARIPRSMLVPMPYAETPLEKSSKGTVLRRVAEEQYATHIAESYDRESATRVEVADEDVESYVLDVVSSIVTPRSAHATLEAETDLFAYGVDSVACVQIRHAASRLLPKDSVSLPFTVVQDAGSVQRLAQVLVNLRHHREIKMTSHDEQLQMMQEYVKQYVQLNLPSDHLAPPPSPPRTPSPTQTPTGKVVLLTGSTGSLGSHLLSQLLNSPQVSHLHLLLRGASHDAARERVREALLSRQLDLPLDFDSRVTVHAGVLFNPRLGLASNIYANLAREVDVIFHLAWSVDFILPLSGFRQHFSGLRNLLSLSVEHAKLDSNTGIPRPARVVFCSSTASVASFGELHQSGSIPEEVQTDPQCSNPVGYSRSKWVAENICLEAVRRNPALRDAVSIVRVGQLSGDTTNGVWNKSEAYPLMLSSAKVTGCLPNLPHESVGWLPVDLAAQAFLQLGLGDGKKCSDDVEVLHVLSQDRTTTWKMLVDWIGAAEGWERVDTSTWLDSLGEMAEPGSGYDTHPSLKLLEFWKTAYESSARPSSSVAYKTDEALRRMPVLGNVQPVDEVYAMKLWTWIKSNV